METMRCPRGLEISPRSFSTCMTIAVEVSTKPAAPTKLTCHGKPYSKPTPVSKMAHTTTCKLPRPKI